MNDQSRETSIRIPDGDLFGLIGAATNNLRNSTRTDPGYVPERNYVSEPCPTYRGIVLN
jgi:hypothetical protein